MGRVHVDHEKAGKTFYAWSATVLLADGTDWMQLAEGEALTVSEAQAAVEAHPVADTGNIIVIAYRWDPELDHEEVRWVSCDIAQDFYCPGHKANDGTWTWDLEDYR